VELDPIIVDSPQPTSQLGGVDESDGNRLTMAKLRHSSVNSVSTLLKTHCFDSMGEGVPVVENHAPTAFALVGCHDLSLDRGASSDLILNVF
jgi:hypothetical protein